MEDVESAGLKQGTYGSHWRRIDPQSLISFRVSSSHSTPPYLFRSTWTGQRVSQEIDVQLRIVELVADDIRQVQHRILG